MRNVLQVKQGDWLKRTLTGRRARPDHDGVDLVYVAKVEGSTATVHRMDRMPDGSLVCGRKTERSVENFSRTDFEPIDPPVQPETQQAQPAAPVSHDTTVAILRELLDMERDRASRAEMRLAVVEAELSRIRGAS